MLKTFLEGCIIAILSIITIIILIIITVAISHYLCIYFNWPDIVKLFLVLTLFIVISSGLLMTIEKYNN